DIVDANASPFNSGPNEVQVPNLIINNNNNSNSLRPTVSLEQAYWSQDFRPGGKVKGNFKTGLVYLGAMFDSNNFANNEALQFMNTQFVNSISWRANYNGPAFVASLEHPLLRGKAFIRGTTSISTMTNRDVFGVYGYNNELQLGHILFNKEGNLRAGFWNWNFRSGSPKPFTTPSDLFGTSLLSVIPGGVSINGPKPVGFYANFDQRIWKDIGLFGRYALNDKNIGEVFLGGLLSARQSFSFGGEIPIKSFIKKRSDDVLGIAFGEITGYPRDGIPSPATPAFLSLNGVSATNIQQVNKNLTILNYGTRSANEKTLEAYYRYHINKNISVSPDIQYIWSPGGTAPVSDIFAISTRLNLVF
ncbi:MAG: carbohydrate porin, partial [Cyanobacteria bacterium]|nr:carbohydrate porin [Cyanobacteriota bacterium]